jgi:uncharacterized protein
MVETLSQPWPWYVAGPLIGLMVPLLLLVGNKLLGISSNFRHACAAVLPSRADFFRYDWRSQGGWNLIFALGILLGALFAGVVLRDPEAVRISAATRADLAGLGISDFSGMVPAELFSWSAIFTLRGLIFFAVGGFLIGFGTAYAGGCTSGHGIAGLANFELPSLLAIIAFFVGGLITTHLILPVLL